jgi:murein tripeptide amidase MpaA
MIKTRLIPILLVVFLCTCTASKQWEGQASITKVNTESRPIQYQRTGSFALGDNIYISNDFPGARMNGVLLTADTLVTVLITPENTPINESPWYAFKMWSENVRTVYVKLTYQEGVRHRYHPKLSRDGMAWSVLDEADYTTENTGISTEGRDFPESATMRLDIGPDTLWVAGQEIITAGHVNDWMQELERRAFISRSTIGQSLLGSDIDMLRIGTATDTRMVVLLGRQHPPEVPGYLALQAFVETICSDSETARAFRDKFATYVIPMMNPDGAGLGHWRHSAAGIDLNRDWQDLNQPETGAVVDMVRERTEDTLNTIYLCVDFHSTYEDIFYTMDPQQETNMPGLVNALIDATGEGIDDYVPNIRPRPADDAPVTSLVYFFTAHRAESLVYEIGDDTPRDFLRQKSELSARRMMEYMLEQQVD